MRGDRRSSHQGEDARRGLEAILARIERGQAADVDPPRTSRAGHRRTAVRTVGMASTVAAVLGFSVAVTWAAVGTDVLRGPSARGAGGPRPGHRQSQGDAGSAHEQPQTIRVPRVVP